MSDTGDASERPAGDSSDRETWTLAEGDRESWPGVETETTALLDQLSDLLYVVDRRNRFVEWNATFRERTGYTDEGIADLDLFDIIPDEAEARARDLLARVASGEEGTLEVPLVTSNGERIPHAFTASPLTDDDGEVWAMVGTSRDITDQKERQRELERYELLLETIGDGVYVLGPDRHVRRANDVLCEMLDYDRETLLGMHLSELVTGDALERAASLREQLQAGETDVVRIEGEMIRADGSRFHAEGRFSLLPSANEATTIGLIRDITDRRERAELLEDLHEASRELTAAETRQEVAETAVRVVFEVFDYPAAGMRLLEGDQLLWAADAFEDERLGMDLPPFEVGEGFIGDAYERGEIVSIDDFQQFDLKYDPSPVRSVLMFPIEGYGILSMAATEPAAFDEVDREIGRLLATDVSLAFERADRSEELRKYETLVETIRDGAYITDADSRFVMVNEGLAELFGTPREKIEGTHLSEFGSEEDTRRAARLRRQLLEGEKDVVTLEGHAERPDGTRVPVESRYSLLPSEDGTFRGTAGVIRDVTERRERETELRARRDELETLNRINELIQETIQTLAGAATREEIERTLCDRLAESSFYRFAATGKRAPDGMLTPTTQAGEGAGYLDEVVIPADLDHDRAGPAARAFETGEVVVSHDIASDPAFEPWRESALTRGFRSVAVVPFTHGETVHGILAVYADRQDAFSDREHRAFEVLGEMVGFAINAIRNRKLVHADAVTELELRITDDETAIVDLTGRLNCTCRLLGLAPTAETGMVHYLSVEGVSPEIVEEKLSDTAACDRVAAFRLISGDEDGCVIEVRLLDSVVELFQESGVRTVDMTVENGHVDVCVQGPRDVDIRGLLTALETTLDTVELVSKREVDADDRTTNDLRTAITDTLTERQAAALNAAYFGGYFDWPRDSTAEEIADALGISSPTLHQHLRHAQRKLLDAYLGPTSRQP